MLHVGSIRVLPTEERTDDFRRQTLSVPLKLPLPMEESLRVNSDERKIDLNENLLTVLGMLRPVDKFGTHHTFAAKLL